MREVNLISSRLASGVTFLTNILLELNIKTIFGPDKSYNFWEETNGQCTIRNDESYYFYRLYTPAFENKRTFSFDKDIEIYFSHFYEACTHDRPIILFVRDPRDAIYSLYKRTNFSEKSDFTTYLTEILSTSQTIRMNPVLEWVYFHEFYLTLSESKTMLIIRFEDIKAQPEKYVRQVLDFIKVVKTDSEIATAIANSSFDKAKKVMLTTEEITNKKSFNPIRRGKSFEWKEWLSPELYTYFSPCNETAQKFNYELISEHKTPKQIDTYTPNLQNLINRIGYDKHINILREVSQRLNLLKYEEPDYKVLLACLLALSWTYRIYKDKFHMTTDSIKIFHTLFLLNKKHLTIDDLYSRVSQDELLSCFPFLDQKPWSAIRRNFLYLAYKFFPAIVSYFMKTRWAKNLKTNTSMVID